jgi:hypothetical protein
MFNLSPVGYNKRDLRYLHEMLPEQLKMEKDNRSRTSFERQPKSTVSIALCELCLVGQFSQFRTDKKADKLACGLKPYASSSTNWREQHEVVAETRPPKAIANLINNVLIWCLESTKGAAHKFWRRLLETEPGPVSYDED